jgi:hypothetical protein
MLRSICALVLCAWWLPAQAGVLQELTHRGRALPVYGNAPTPELERILAAVKRGRIAERLAQSTQASALLKRDLAVVVTSCGPQGAAYFDGRRSAVVMCLELIDLVKRMMQEDAEFASRLSADEKTKLAEGALIGIYLHELAHALVTINGIPITGREEDVADQFSIYFAATFIEPRGVPVILPTIWFFRQLAKQRDLLNADSDTMRRMLANEHSLDEQCIYNFACWSLGSGGKSGPYAVQMVGLPQERAGRCTGEYLRMQQGIRARFQKYLIIKQK